MHERHPISEVDKGGVAPPHLEKGRVGFEPDSPRPGELLVEPQTVEGPVAAEPVCRLLPGGVGPKALHDAAKTSSSRGSWWPRSARMTSAIHAPK